MVFCIGACGDQSRAFVLFEYHLGMQGWWNGRGLIGGGLEERDEDVGFGVEGGGEGCEKGG